MVSHHARNKCVVANEEAIFQDRWQTIKQDRQCKYNVILRIVRATSVAVESNK
jgi:hypothetical protein